MDVPHFNYKRITDPIHGTIGLSELEIKVVNSNVFQRLRNVKQLGLAHYVFPGADYSRFTHSLGVCHITGRILGSLVSKGSSINEEDLQRYRLAALLHDVGHYPYSHTMEVPIENHYKKPMIVNKSSGSAAEKGTDEIGTKVASLNHELVGKEILSQDKELRSILGAKYQPQEIYSIILRESPTLYGNLVSSDLDADRCDFMLRSSHFTGLPYGSVDIDYLVSQVCLDNDGRLCLTAKALRTADHFLLSRYFDYQQIPFNKTVTAFELVLKDVIAALLEDGRINCSAASVSEMIAKGQWSGFDDRFILEEIKNLQADNASNIKGAKARAIIDRKPPKLLAEVQRIRRRDKSEERDFLGLRQSIRDKIPQWSTAFGIDQSRWYLWEPPSMVLTKIGSRIPVSAMLSGDKEKDKYDQSIRLLNRAGDKSMPIVEIPDSLMNILSDYALYSVRVYVLLDESEEKRRQEIEARIEKDLPHMDWK